MSIIIKGLSVPQSCAECACTNYFGDCLLVNKLRPDVGIEEYDYEWHKAHKEHRRMKYCPIVDPTEYEKAMIEEILREKDKPRNHKYEIKIKTTPEDMKRIEELLKDPAYVAKEEEFENTLRRMTRENNGSQQD